MVRLKALGMAAALVGGLTLATGTATQAAPVLDGTLSAARGADVTPVRYGESYRHYRYRQAHRAYRRDHRAYRAERRYRYGY